ncbi:MAG TPA: hypothetical protein VIH40_09435 [Xanthobacteraceae bacterium]
MSGLVHRRCVERAARANGALARTLVWSGLGISVIASAIYDVGHWVAAW